MVGLVEGPDSGLYSYVLKSQDEGAIKCSKLECLVTDMYYYTASSDSRYAIHESCSRMRRMAGEVDVV
jgi:hypothetical protein